MRRAARVDSNHVEIVKAFRAAGCSVFSTASLGRGFPDLAIGFAGLTMLIEIKHGAKSPSRRKLTDGEEGFRMRWTGGMRLVQCLADVHITFETLRRWHEAITDQSRKSEIINTDRRTN